jgi:RimJ/RimL family protein N-acetyltransferase
MMRTASTCAQSSNGLARDGSQIILRPLEPWDTELVSEVFDGLGPASRYHRFLVPKVALTVSELRQLTGVDHVDHEAIAAISAVDGRIIGIGRFIRLRSDSTTAELAITVIDAWHRRGVGCCLAEALIERARAVDIRTFSVFIARDNQAAVQLMNRLPGDLERVAADRQATEFAVTLPRSQPESSAC